MSKCQPAKRAPPWAVGFAGGGLLVAAQDGAHPGDELAGLEGLDEVVVGAQLEAQHPVGEAVAAGEDEGRAGVLLLQQAQHLQAVHVGQAEVEDGQLGLHLAGAGQQARPVPKVSLRKPYSARLVAIRRAMSARPRR
jgi:hypothetical protein